jgi:uncharacterized glyoxalase superfamily protein PhnB
MPSLAKATTVTVIPTMRYHDAPAAIEWLCSVFGFEKHVVYAGEDGTIGHAELTFGNGMIMLGSARDDDYGKLVSTPGRLGGATTQSAYVIVTDADALYAKAKAAGAEITRELNTTDYGSREFACRDLEGHLWNFGTYDPWSVPPSA